MTLKKYTDPLLLFLLGFYPFAFIIGKSVAEIFAGVFCLLVMALLIFPDQETQESLPKLLPSPSLKLFLGLLFASWFLILVSSLLSPYEKKYLDLAFAYGRWPLYIFSLLLYATWFGVGRMLKWSSLGCLFASSFLALDMCFQAWQGVDFFGIPAHSAYRITGPLPDPNAGMYLTFFAPLGLLAIHQTFSTSRRALLASFAYLGLILVAVFLSGERIFLAYTLISMLLIIALWLGWRSIFAAAAMAIVIAGIALNFPSHLDRYTSKTLKELTSTVNHISAFELTTEGSYANNMLRGLKAVGERPLLGHGMNGFRLYCPVQENRSDHGCTTHPHHTHLTIATTGGLPLLAVWFAFMGIVGYWICLALIKSPANTKWQAGIAVWIFLPFASPLFISENFLVNSSELLFWPCLGGALLLLSTLLSNQKHSS